MSKNYKQMYIEEITTKGRLVKFINKENKEYLKRENFTKEEKEAIKHNLEVVHVEGYISYKELYEDLLETDKDCWVQFVIE